MSELVALALAILRIGSLAFGGSSAILPELHREVVETHGWLSEREFVDGFALGQLTPGPALLMVVFVGYRVAGLAGAVAAAAAIVLPCALGSALLVANWPRMARAPWLAAFQRGLPAVALGLASAGAYTILGVTVTDPPTAAVAAGAAAVLWWGRLHPTLVILAGGAASVLLALVRP